MTPKQEAAARQALHRLQAHTDTADLDAIAALNEALAEQQAAEPVAWANPNDLQNFDMKVRTNGGPLHTVPLYTHPAPTQQPLTDELITAEAWVHHRHPQGTVGSKMFRAGVRYAEHKHGITGSKT